MESNLPESLQYIALCKIIIPANEASYLTASFICGLLFVYFILSILLFEHSSPPHIQILMKQGRPKCLYLIAEFHSK